MKAFFIFLYLQKETAKRKEKKTLKEKQNFKLNERNKNNLKLRGRTFTFFADILFIGSNEMRIFPLQ